MAKTLNILLVEDDPLCQWAQREIWDRFVEVPSFAVYASCEEVSLSGRDFSRFDLALIDLDLEGERDGFEVLRVLKRASPSLFCVILSGARDAESVRKAYEMGADDYLVKPLSAKNVKHLLGRLEEKNTGTSFKENFSCSRELLEKLSRLECEVNTDSPLLLQGETGTGKTHLAKHLHSISERSEGPFIHLNCSEVAESLIESELFGHKRGSFSGAVGDKKGKLELADGGTLFLDELGSMPLKVQAKLLKAIEEKNFFPVGAEKSISSDFRVMSATCGPLAELVKKGEFREDLFFRLYGHQLILPALRERKEDIDFFLEKFLDRSNRKIFLSSEVRGKFRHYFWPGNVRELEKVTAKLLASPNPLINLSDLPEHLRKNCHPLETKQQPDGLESEERVYFDLATEVGLKKAVERLENDLVKFFLDKNGGKVRPTLGDLHISNSSFYRIFDRLSK